MSWRDQMQRGFFRDAYFLIQGHDAQVGRRTQTHEYPQRDKPFVEDLGRKTREFTLECFVIGDDYMTDRDALIAALEQAGPGTLVHPYWGEMTVSATACRVTETTAKGGMATFSITFIESGDKTFPDASADTWTIVVGASDSAWTDLESAFSEAFDVVGDVSSFVQEAAGFAAMDAFDLIGVVAEYAGLGGAYGDVLGFVSDVAGIQSSITTLLTTPSTFASDTAGVLGSVAGLYNDAGTTTQTGASAASSASSASSQAAATSTTSTAYSDSATRQKAAVAALRTIQTFGTADYVAPPATVARQAKTGAAPSNLRIPATTAQRTIQAANYAAIVRLVQTGALIEEARATADLPFASRDEAVAVRDDLAERLDAAAESAPDKSYQALVTLRAAVVKDCTARGANLAIVVRVENTATLPALVVAHRIYGDAGRADDIVSRNRVRHPGFVPGGRALEVLSA